MLIKSTRIRTSSGARALINHLENGDENDAVISVQGDAKDLRDAVWDAKSFSRTFALRHWVIAPGEDLDDTKFMQFAAIHAAEFGFDLSHAFIRKHGKDRADPTSFPWHWHIVVAEVDPVSGRTLSSAKD